PDGPGTAALALGVSSTGGVGADGGAGGGAGGAGRAGGAGGAGGARGAGRAGRAGPVVPGRASVAGGGGGSWLTSGTPLMGTDLVSRHGSPRRIPSVPVGRDSLGMIASRDSTSSGDASARDAVDFEASARSPEADGGVLQQAEERAELHLLVVPRARVAKQGYAACEPRSERFVRRHRAGQSRGNAQRRQRGRLP